MPVPRTEQAPVVDRHEPARERRAVRQLAASSRSSTAQNACGIPPIRTLAAQSISSGP